MGANYKAYYEIWKANAKEDSELYEDLLSIDKKNSEKKDRFSSNLEFGTSGLRAVMGAGTNRVNIYTIRKVTQAVSMYLTNIKPDAKVAIAYDTRKNSLLFAKQTAQVLAKNGIKAFLFKAPTPIPVLSYCVPKYGFDMGIMITASHNSARYNGYKVYGDDGSAISVWISRIVTENIEKVRTFEIELMDFDEAVKKKLIKYIDDSYVKDYIDATVAQSVIKDNVPKDVKIVYTPLHGCGQRCVVDTLKADGFNDITVVEEQAADNGEFKTCFRPNPERKEVLDMAKELGSKIDADVLLCTDPDGDRCGVGIKTENGYEILSGNRIGILLLDFLCTAKKEYGTLSPNPTMFKSVVTTDMFKEMEVRYNVEVSEALIGFKSISNLLAILDSNERTDEFVLAVEESNGFLNRMDVRDKDGINACLLVAEMVAYYKSKGITPYVRLRQLFDEFGYYKSAVLSYEFEGIKGAKFMTKLMKLVANGDFNKYVTTPVDKIADFNEGTINRSHFFSIGKANMVKVFYKDGTTIIVRPSGTEPYIKFYISVKGSSFENAIELCEKYSGFVNAFMDKMTQEFN